MLDDRFNMWTHSAPNRELYRQRARNEVETMTCVAQLVDLLKEQGVMPGMTLLDAGCGTGWYYRALRNLGIKYHGLDSTREFIEIGRECLPAAGLPPERLQHGMIENVDTCYDIVIAFNLFLWMPDYRMGLERLCNASRRYLVIRTLLGDEDAYLYDYDNHLDEGWNHLKCYMNTYAMQPFIQFIESYGFSVKHIVDRRTNDEPELNSIGRIFNWRMLFCTKEDNDDN